MEHIIQNLITLKGVHHACIFHDGEMLATSLTDETADAMLAAAETIEQIFHAVQAIERSHDEIYFSLGNKYVAAYLLNDADIVLLITEKKINFPLVHMGVKSAAGKLQKMREQLSQPEVPGAAEAAAPVHVPTSEEVKTHLIRMGTILMGYLGPAAMLVVDDNVEVWKQKFPQTIPNLEHLVVMLAREIADENDREKFTDQALAILE